MANLNKGDLYLWIKAQKGMLAHTQEQQRWIDDYLGFTESAFGVSFQWMGEGGSLDRDIENFDWKDVPTHVKETCIKYLKGIVELQETKSKIFIIADALASGESVVVKKDTNE